MIPIFIPAEGFIFFRSFFFILRKLNYSWLWLGSYATRIVLQRSVFQCCAQLVSIVCQVFRSSYFLDYIQIYVRLLGSHLIMLTRLPIGFVIILCTYVCPVPQLLLLLLRLGFGVTIKWLVTLFYAAQGKPAPTLYRAALRSALYYLLRFARDVVPHSPLRSLRSLPIPKGMGANGGSGGKAPQGPVPPGARQRKQIYGIGGPEGPRLHMNRRASVRRPGYE